MKKLAIALTILISLNVFSQEKKIFSTEFNEFVLQCETIGRTLIDKNKATDLNEWYDGRYKELFETNIKQLESDIDNSVLDVTFLLTKVYEDLQVYRLHFYSKETKLEFGQLYISFRNKRDDMVDGLVFLTKEKMELLALKPDKNPSLFDISPSLKKKEN